MTNRYLEKLAELYERPATTSGLSPSILPSKRVNLKKPVESITKSVTRKLLTKSAIVAPPPAANANFIQKLHEASGRAAGVFGGMWHLVGDTGHLLSGGSTRDIVSRVAKTKNPYLTHKQIEDLVYKKDHELSKYLVDNVPGNINHHEHPVFMFDRERNRRDGARVVALTGLGGAALYKYRKDQENKYSDSYGPGYYQ